MYLVNNIINSNSTNIKIINVNNIHIAIMTSDIFGVNNAITMSNTGTDTIGGGT